MDDEGHAKIWQPRMPSGYPIEAGKDFYHFSCTACLDIQQELFQASQPHLKRDGERARSDHGTDNTGSVGRFQFLSQAPTLNAIELSAENEAILLTSHFQWSKSGSLTQSVTGEMCQNGRVAAIV